MSAFLFNRLVEPNTEIGRFVREVDNHYHLQLAAENSQQLLDYNKELLSLQGKQADVVIKSFESLNDVQREANSNLQDTLDVISRGLSDVNNSLENLAEVGTRTTEAVVALSGIVSHGLRVLSHQIERAQQTLNEIVQVLRQPYETKALELRKEADKWLTLGARTDGRDQDENFKDAMRLLTATTENLIGKQD